MNVNEALLQCKPGPGGMRVAVTVPGAVKIAIWEPGGNIVIVDIADGSSRGASLPGGGYGEYHQDSREFDVVGFIWRPAVVEGSETHEENVQLGEA